MRGIHSIKDPGSAITHFIGLIMAAAATVPLLVKTSARGDSRAMLCMTVFMLSMILLYAASTIYHTFDVNDKVNRILQKIQKGIPS